MKRFYETVAVVPQGDGYAILLDGKPVKTPNRQSLNVAQKGLAEAIAAEWQAQATDILPHTMPLMQLATTVADRVCAEREGIVRTAAAYIESDLVCYRTAEPEALVLAQSDRFDPVLEWFEERTGMSLAVTRGILPITQPPEAIEIAMAQLEGITDESLAIAYLAISLTASFVLGLAFALGILNAAELFEAGFVDDLHQQKIWGRDEEAALRLDSIRLELTTLETYQALTA